MSEIISMKQNPLRVKATFEVLATSYKDISKEEYQNYVRNLKNKIR